ncbi:MAG: hypothetical protein AAF493_11280 [Pseudomonadota bacterium]
MPDDLDTQPSPVAAERPALENGTRCRIDEKDCIYFDGYWIRYYPPPEDTLAARKSLILSLTKRTFHHTEAGINTPGENLEKARVAYENETDPRRKRVNAAMLAGALFNRATDIFTSVVELAERGVVLSPTSDLMRKCGRCFKEALELGRQVKHHSGQEGIDELWGEPLKAFTMPIAEFYSSRYVKIAQTLRDIDRIALTLHDLFVDQPGFDAFPECIAEYAIAAKLEAETMRSDAAILDVWPRFVAAGECLTSFRPANPARSAEERLNEQRIIADGQALISWLAGARVPMPKSTKEYLERCDALRSARRVNRLASVVGD